MNECSGDPPPCQEDQYCLNTDGSYSCKGRILLPVVLCLSLIREVLIKRLSSPSQPVTKSVLAAPDLVLISVRAVPADTTSQRGPAKVQVKINTTYLSGKLNQEGVS